jgi:hypothetical protein
LQPRIHQLQNRLKHATQVATEASLDTNCELAALYKSQSMRAANRKALKPQPTRQAKLVANPDEPVLQRYSIQFDATQRNQRFFQK